MYKSFDFAFKPNLNSKKTKKETLKKSILQNHKNHLKALINSKHNKGNKGPSKQDQLLLLFNTEDNRSSFGQPISGWPSGGGPSNGVSQGQAQNKTSSSKKKSNYKKSQRSFDNVTSKKNNFMDEFDKFEELVDNQLTKSKGSSHLKRHSVSFESKPN